MHETDSSTRTPTSIAIGVRFAVIGTLLVLIGAEPMSLAVVVVAIGYEIWRRAL